MVDVVEKRGHCSEVRNLAGFQACPLGLLMPSFPGQTSARLGRTEGKEETKKGLRKEDTGKGTGLKDSKRVACKEVREREPCSATSLTSPVSLSQSGPCQPHINTVNLWKVSLLSGGSPSLLAHFIFVYLAPPLSLLVLGKFWWW